MWSGVGMWGSGGCRACGLGCECGGVGGVELVVWGANAGVRGGGVELVVWGANAGVRGGVELVVWGANAGVRGV